jgi:hypothetical protein
MSALIVIFVFIFQFLAASRRAFQATVICNKSVSYKIGLTQDGPPQVIVWTKCDELENRMIRPIGLWLVVCALCVTPVAADEDVYDGPTAIKPLTVTPKPQQSAPPTLSAISNINAIQRRADPWSRRPLLPRSWPPSRPLPGPRFPMIPSSRHGATA